MFYVNVGAWFDLILGSKLDNRKARTLVTSKEKPIILIVDDDQAVRTSLKFMLELEGLTVDVCASGDELLLHPELTRASCLLIDYKMPTMDGFEVIAHLKKRNIHVPMIMITSVVNNSLARRAANAGICRLLEKPLVDDVLCDNIYQILSATPLYNK